MKKNIFWYQNKEPAVGEKLSGNISTDVVVVGGGMAGLSCAQRLREAGMSVVLVEKDFCGTGASGKTSGFITPDSEIELSSLLRNYGREKAKNIWEFVLSGVEMIRKNIKINNILCDYQVQDSLFIANSSTKTKYVEEEHSARETLGYTSNLYNAKDLEKIIGTNNYKSAVRYPDTFAMNSYLYCQALRDIIIKVGVKVYEDTNVLRINPDGVDTPLGKVTAKKVIVCTDRFIPDLGVLRKEIYHVQTFLGISKQLNEKEIKKIFKESKMMVWDTDLVYNYFRVTGDNRILLGGGDVLYTYAHNPSYNTARFKRRLTAYFKKKFPNVAIELEYVWPGMLGVSKDLLPIMGADEKMENVWYVGAATGLPWAAALGTYAAEKVINGRDEFDDIFSWRRKFIIGPRMQALLTTPVTYAVSHGIAKYIK
ncbi:MAG: FAD-binding oxidoreductase [Candidatus Paceibacterota bacterium]